VIWIGTSGWQYRDWRGVLYPAGLVAGDLVRIEYDATDPDLARVAGRTATLTLLPLGSTVLITWAVAIGLLWWIRHRREARAAREAGALTGGRPGLAPAEELTVATPPGLFEPLQQMLEDLGTWHD